MGEHLTQYWKDNALTGKSLAAIFLCIRCSPWKRSHWRHLPERKTNISYNIPVLCSVTETVLISMYFLFNRVDSTVSHCTPLGFDANKETMESRLDFEIFPPMSPNHSQSK